MLLKKIVFYALFLFVISPKTQAFFPRPLGVVQAVAEIDYPQVGLITTLVDFNICSGTLVGPRAVLTAGHCGSNEERRAIFLNNQVYYGTTYSMKSYKGVSKGREDLAIIILDREVKGITPWEIDLTPLNIGQILFFSGFGLSDEWAEDGAGKQRTGRVLINERSYFAYTSIRDKYNSTVGAGDSGGPLFAEKNNHITIFGINSSGSGSTIMGRDYTITSYFTNLSLPYHSQFLKDLAQLKNITIKGIHNAIEEQSKKSESSLPKNKTCLEQAIENKFNIVETINLCYPYMQINHQQKVNCHVEKRSEGITFNEALKLCRSIKN